MKHFFIVVVITCLFASPASATIGKPQVTPEIVLQAIEVFRDNPIGEQADAALSVVAQFAQSSPHVLVVIEERVFPFEIDTIGIETRSKLVGAYLAGNVEYQLNHRVKQNRPYEGIILMILAYEAMRSERLVDNIAGFEEWIILRDNGKLRSVIDI